MEKIVDVAIIGGGTSGLNALGQVRKTNKSFVLINGGYLGTTCARVGCMPSKALIQIAEDFHRRQIFNRQGIKGNNALSVNQEIALEHVRDLRDIFVDRVLGASTDELEHELIEGYAQFLEPNVLRVNNQIIRANRIVIATGSRPVVPEPWTKLGEQILTTDELFEQESLPNSIAVIGMGIIGLELGQALRRYGLEVIGIDQITAVAGLSDPLVNKTAIDIIGQEFPIWLGAPATVMREGKKLRVRAGSKKRLGR